MRARLIRVLLVLVGAALANGAVAADFKLWYPDAEFGETALETLGDWGHSPAAARSGAQSYTEEFERGMTPFWRTELELEQEREPGPGERIHVSEIATENVFQFTERGQYWLDAGFFFKFAHPLQPKAPNETTLGPILRKEVWRTIDTVNLFIEKDLGSHAQGRPNFLYAWETRLALGTKIEPGFQAYGRPSPNGRVLGDQRIGPTLFGTVFQLGPGKLRWNAGILFGVTPAAPRETIRWQAEYEIHF